VLWAGWPAGLCAVAELVAGALLWAGWPAVVCAGWA
jgi:hypothetical protein